MKVQGILEAGDGGGMLPRFHNPFSVAVAQKMLNLLISKCYLLLNNKWVSSWKIYLTKPVVGMLFFSSY